MRIAAIRPYIEQYLGSPLEVQLLRLAKILAITYSNQIEGNRLEERGGTKALEYFNEALEIRIAKGSPVDQIGSTQKAIAQIQRIHKWI